MRGSGSALAAGAVIWIFALGPQALAEPSRCFENGDIVTFDGVAIPGAIRSQWLLKLSQPICVSPSSSSAGTRISTIRIIGTPPPLGIPLELMGKLMLGRSATQSEMYVALIVSRGRKIRATKDAPHSPPKAASPPSASAARNAAPARSAPIARAAGNCNAPPYGGTPEDYRAFVQRFGRIVKPEKILADVCNAKFGNSPRDQLHKLGLSDSKIDSESTERLAEDTIVALKNLVNKLE